jgi:hypothetical protein
VSYDKGVTWNAWSSRTSVYPANAAGVSSSQSPAAPPLALAPAQTVKFGIQPLTSAGGPGIDEADCDLAVRLDSAS